MTYFSVYAQALEIAVRCARELSGTPDLIEAYDSAQRDNRALDKFRTFCLAKAKDELEQCETGVTRIEKDNIYIVAAQEISGLTERGSLETKHNDDEDFMVVSVWELSAALEKVYRLGVSDGKSVNVLKSSIIKALDTSSKPMEFSEIMEALGDNAGRLALHEALAVMIARKRLVSYVDDDGRVVYEIAEV